jgi:hypothetical protein
MLRCNRPLILSVGVSGGMAVKIFWSSILGAALATVSASANAGVFYSSIPDLTVAPNVAEGACSTCISSGLQWAGEAFSLSSTETVRSIEFAVAAATFPTSVTLGFYGVGGSMSVGAQVGSNFTLSTASYETITPGSQPTNLVTAYLAGGGQTLDAGSYLLFITNPIDLALPEYLNDGKGIFIINQPLADGATYKPIGNGFDLGVALSNSVPEPSTWAMMLVGFAGLGYAGYRRAREPRAAT